MASLLGMSFGMGAVDVGMEAAVGSAIKSLDTINTLLDEQNKVAEQNAKTWGTMEKAAVSFGKTTSGAAEDALNELKKMLGEEEKKSTESRKSWEKLRKVIGGVSKGTKKAMGVFVKFTKTSVSGLKTVGSTASAVYGGIQKGVQRFNIAAIAGNVRSLTGETGRLTNGLEAMGVANAQAAKPIVAQLSLTGKAARKMTGQISGMAIGLNVGASEIAEVFKAIHNASGAASKGLDAMNMSHKDWVKVVTTTGVSMQDYNALMGDMIASYGASPKAAAALLNNLVAIGKEAKIGSLAIKNAKAHLDSLDDIFEKLPPSMARTADEMQSLMESTYKLAGAFVELGNTEEDSTQLAQNTAKMFAEQAVAIQKAQMGLGSYEDSPLFQWLTRLGVSGQEAIEMIQEGSRDAVAGAQRIQSAMAQGVKRGTVQADSALSGLSEALGSSAGGLGFLLQNLDAGTEALGNMATMTVKGEDALKKYGKQAHSSGRTLQEAFDLAKESFETQVRSIARSKVGNLVKRQIKAYRSVGKELKQLGSDETWGPLMNAVSVFDQMGPRGVFLALSDQLGMNTDAAIKAGIKFEYAFDKVKQFGEEMGPIMEILGMFGPAGPILAIGGIAALFMLDDKESKEILGSYHGVFQKVKAMIVEQFNKLPWDKIKKVWETTVLPKLEAFGVGVGKVLFKGLKLAGAGLVEEMGPLGLAVGAALGASIAASAAFGPVGLIAAAVLGAIYVGYKDASMKIDEAEKKKKEQKKREENRRRKNAEKLKDKTRAGGKKAMDFVFGATDKPQMSMVPGAGGSEEDFWRGQEVDWMTHQIHAEKVAKDKERLLEPLVNLARTNKKFKRSLMESEGLTWEVGAAGGGKALEAFDTKRLPKLMEQMVEAGKAKDLIKQLQGTGRTTGLIAAGMYQDTLADMKEGLIQFQASEYEIYEFIKRQQAEQPLRLSEDLMSSETADILQEGGVTTADNFSLGIEKGYDIIKTASEGAATQATNNLGSSSAIPDGPLSGEGPANAVYMGGYETMRQFAMGIVSGAEDVKGAVESVIDKSVIKTITAYKEKMEELGKKKSVLRSIAQQMVRDFGGKMEMGTIEIDEVKSNSKAMFEAALNVPGMGGVIAAVISDGHQTRKVLSKIYDQTKRTADALTGTGDAVAQVKVLP